MSTNDTVGMGGGISNDGVMTIVDSIVDDNTAGSHGGGIVQADEGSLSIQHHCRAQQLLESELPRLRELQTVGQVTLP